MNRISGTARSYTVRIALPPWLTRRKAEGANAARQRNGISAVLMHKRRRSGGSSMRLYTTLAVTAAAAALTFNFWQFSGQPPRPPVIDDLQPVFAEADDDLTLLLRQQARTAMLDLQ